MKRLFLILVMLCAASSAFAQFPIAALTATNDPSVISSDFDDFFWRASGFSDYTLTLTVENIGVISNYFGQFKVSKDSVGGGRTNYIVKGTSEVTMGEYSMQVSLSHTNIPPDDTYMVEYLLVDTLNTNNTRSVGRGTMETVDSLFDDDDGTYVYTAVSLIDYLTKVEAALTYEPLGGGSGSSSGEPIQGGVSTNGGTTTTVTYPVAYTGSTPSVVISLTTNFSIEASAKIQSINMTNFVVRFTSGAGAVTNAWPFYWISTPTNASGTVGYTDAQAVAAVNAAKNFGTIITFDQGNTSNQIPTWTQVTSHVGTVGADVYTSSNNVYDAGTIQAMQGITANYITINNTNMVTNGTFAVDAEWSYDAKWAIAGGAAIYSSTGAFTTLQEIYVDIGAIAGHTYKVTYTYNLVNGAGVFFQPTVGGGAGINRLVGGTYTENIVAVNTDVFTFELTPALGGTVNATLDNVTILDLTMATQIDEGIITIGGETVTWEKIVAWDNTSVDTNTFYLASNPSNFVDQTITNGLGALYVNVSGDTMTGNLVMGTNTVWGGPTEGLRLGFFAGAGASGSRNLYAGFKAGEDANGQQNFYGGMQAGLEATGDDGFYGGYSAGWRSAGDRCFYGGREAGRDSGGSDNAYLGIRAGEDSTNTTSLFLGGLAGYQSKGTLNGYFGYLAGREAASTNNTYIGYQAGRNGAGQNDVFIGAHGTSLAAHDPTVDDQIYIDGDTEIVYLGATGSTVVVRNLSASSTGSASGLTNIPIAQTTGGVWSIYAYNGSGVAYALANGAANTFLRSSGSSSALGWGAISATATNVGIADLTNVPAASSFIVGNGTNYVTNSLAQIQTLLGVGSSTNLYVTNIQDIATANYHIVGNGTYWQTQALITTIQAIDGAGSGLDADTLDGVQGAGYGVVSDNIFQFANTTSNGFSAGQVLKFTAAGVLTPSNDLQTAVDTNALQTMWVAADTTLSNNLEAMYIAADVVVSSAYGAADTAVSNNLKAMYIAADGVLSNNVLAVYAAADTALSNNLVTMYTAADLAMSNNIATEFITSNSIWLATMVAKSETQAVNVAFAITNLPIGSLVYTGGNNVETVATNAARAATGWTLSGTNITMVSEGAVTIGTNTPTAGAALDLRGIQVIWQGAEAMWIGVATNNGDLLIGGNGTPGADVRLRVSDNFNRINLGPTTSYPAIESLGTTNIQFTIGGNQYIFPE